MDQMTRAKSGRPVEELTVEEVLDTAVGVDDIRIHPDELGRQAQVARDHGNPQLARNFERAAELIALGDHEILEMYELLRPGRASPEELQDLVLELRERGLVACAELVAEAVETYRRRDLGR